MERVENFRIYVMAALEFTCNIKLCFVFMLNKSVNLCSGFLFNKKKNQIPIRGKMYESNSLKSNTYHLGLIYFSTDINKGDNKFNLKPLGNLFEFL